MKRHASPVIFDDGGSTRIRKLANEGAGAMNGLLDVLEHKGVAQSTAIVAGPFHRLVGVSISTNDMATQFVNRELEAGDKFTIESDNGFTVCGTVNEKGDCKITVRGSADSPPLMEARQVKCRRSYLIANAGPIQTIVGVAGGAEFGFRASECTIYTTLIMTVANEHWRDVLANRPPA